MKLEGSSDIIRVMKKTSQGDVLLELEATAENGAKFGEALQQAGENTGEVCQLSPKSQMEILDLDVDAKPSSDLG